MKYYLLAGEASGDLHAAYLMQAIQAIDAAAVFRFWGGDRMQAVGGTLVVHYRERAIMGFAEVLKKLPKLAAFIWQCKQDIMAFQPDRLIFIDNSGFNLRIAPWAKAAGFNTHYYISPQVWASRSGRVATIQASVDQMYVVLPFVKDFYAAYGYEVQYVGHPLLDVVADFRAAKPDPLRWIDLKGGAAMASPTTPIVALLPGSRKQEISSVLPIMLAAAARHPAYTYVIAVAPAQDLAFYQQLLAGVAQRPPTCRFVIGQTYALLAESEAALVTSGTATLETALFEVPQAVCYKGGWLSYQIAKRLIKTRYISLVNLVLDEALVPELLQNELSPATLAAALSELLQGPLRAQQQAAFPRLTKALGERGAAQKTAALIVQNGPRNFPVESPATPL